MSRKLGVGKAVLAGKPRGRQELVKMRNKNIGFRLKKKNQNGQSGLFCSEKKGAVDGDW